MGTLPPKRPGSERLSPSSRTLEAPQESTRSKTQRALGAIALVVIGALLATAVPRLVEEIWPAVQIQTVAFIAYQNGRSGDSYFQVEPDWKVLSQYYEECNKTQYDAPTLLESADWNRCFNFEEFGGFPAFGGASISISNPQDSSIQVTDVLAVIDRRVDMTFAAKYEPPIGSDIGESLAFNLNEDYSRAVFVKTNDDLPVVLSSKNPLHYFDSKHIEVEARQTESLIIHPVSDFNGLIEWHMEIYFEALDSSGVRKSMTAIVVPRQGAFRGVPGHVKATIIKQALDGSF